MLHVGTYQRERERGRGGGTCCLDLNKGTPIRTKCYSSRGVLFEELCDLQYCTEYVYFLIRKEYLKPVTKKMHNYEYLHNLAVSIHTVCLCD